MGTCCSQPQTEQTDAELSVGKSRHPIDLKWEQYEVPCFDVDTQSWEFYQGKKIETLLQHTDLVDLRYIIENAEAGRRVPRWQDVPRGAKINAANAHRIKATGKMGLAILVLSYPWLDPDHPDKGLSTMRRLLPIMKAFLAGLGERADERGSTVGLLMDYPCLPQKSTAGGDDRSEEEKAKFKKGLATINRWYLHQWTTVIVYDVEMPGKDSGYSNLRPHSQRGWCDFELRASSLVKASACLWSLRGFEDGGEQAGKQEYEGAKGAAIRTVIRSVPMGPDCFGKILRTGVKTGDLAFTAKADLEVVVEQYAKAFEEAYAETDRLVYMKLGWGNAELKLLASSLTIAREAGGLAQLKYFHVDDNPCSEAGLIPLIEALQGNGCILQATGSLCTEAGKNEVREKAKASGVTVAL